MVDYHVIRYQDLQVGDVVIWFHRERGPLDDMVKGLEAGAPRKYEFEITRVGDNRTRFVHLRSAGRVEDSWTTNAMSKYQLVARPSPRQYANEASARKLREYLEKLL